VHRRQACNRSPELQTGKIFRPRFGGAFSWFFSDVRVVVSDLLARVPEKLDPVPHGAPAGHRAESRPEIRLVGTVTGRRFDVPGAGWKAGIAESKVAFPGRSTILPAQVRYRRNQADIGPRLAPTPDLRRMAVCPTHPLSLSWEKNQKKVIPQGSGPA